MTEDTAGRLPGSGQEGGRGGTTLRRGSAEEAGLIGGQLEQLVAEAAAFLGPSPDHPWYAGAVLLAGRGGTVALHRPVGSAVRYTAYDERTDSGVELPPGERIAMAEDTVFDLASVSKLFTAVLAVQQIERGVLRLNGEVARYLTEFGRAGKQDITVRQLLTHTSGLRAWVPLYEAPTRAGRRAVLFDEAPARPPGSAYLYSDLNMITLGLLLEEITGHPLDALLHSEITAPLGMRHTRYNPPDSWKPKIAATEDARPSWSGLGRGLLRGEVHDENAYAFGGVAGHAGVFSCAWDLAVLARTLLNGGSYGRTRILRPESARLMLTDLNTRFPGAAHGLGFELGRRWYMGAMTTPATAGHTGFTGTSLVLDPAADSFLVVLANSVHPVRGWRSGSAPRVAAADRMARAVPVRTEGGGPAWFSGMTGRAPAVLGLPPVLPVNGRPLLRCSLWWDTDPSSAAVFLEASLDSGTTWRPVPFTTLRAGGRPLPHPDGSAAGWSGRSWHRLDADLAGFRPGELRLRWRYPGGGPHHGRGVYVTGQRIEDDGHLLFDETRAGDAARIEAAGWTVSTD